MALRTLRNVINRGPAHKNQGWHWTAVGAITLVGAAIYAPTLSTPFVFDDHLSIANNPTIRHLWPPGGALSPPHGQGITVEGRPILNFSLALNHVISGLNAWSYHALNVLIHISAGLALFGIARRALCSSVRTSAPAGSRRGQPAGCCRSCARADDPIDPTSNQRIDLFWLALVFIALALTTFPAAGADALAPLDVREVKVGGEIGRRIAITVANNLLKLDVDADFLRPFTESPRTGKFIGLGMMLDSAVRFAAHTDDAQVVALKRHLVAKIIAAQEADGYIGTFEPAKRIQTLWDVHELSYLIWALLEDHRYFGEAPSLAGARKAADYLVKNGSLLPPDWGRGAEVAPHVAFTGIERTMLALHRATGDAAYLRFVTQTRALPEWNLGIVIGRRQGIEGHIYAYMARCLAQLELHRLQPSVRLLDPAQRALDFMTRHDGALLTGSAGQCEIWNDDQDARGDVGESCALAYQLRVFDSLLRLNANPRMGDLMERTIFNALFASQSPDGRRLRYFAPLEGNRVYWKTDTYCCPCNFRRIIAELPAFVFYRANDGVTVNLYAPAQATIDFVTFRQETDYPNSGRVRLSVSPEKPTVFTLRLRIPSWATQASVTVNGQSADGAVKPGAFFAVRREWRTGDEVQLEMPMAWRLVKGRQRQAGRVAVMRGPQVFCLDPAQNPALAKLDGTELGYLALNPNSLGEPVRNTAVRPDGLGCSVQMWKAGFGLAKKTDYELTLTEFPNSEGKATYFRLRDYSGAADDELFSGR